VRRCRRTPIASRTAVGGRGSRRSAAGKVDATKIFRNTTFREVFADSEFRAVFCGFGLSTPGDFLARGAVTIGVYTSSQSPVLAAITYALTFLPDLIGGALLSGLADRYSRKTVMITADLLRAGLVAVMATSGLPLAAVWLLLLAVRLLDSPFRSAQTATLSVMLTGDRYVVGTSANTMLANMAVGVGFAGAGAVAQQLGMSTALYINAGTFVGSALLIWTGVRSRRATGPGTAPAAWPARAEISPRRYPICRHTSSTER